MNKYVCSLMSTAVQIHCLLIVVVGNQLNLQCKIYDNKFKGKGTAQLCFMSLDNKSIIFILFIEQTLCCTLVVEADQSALLYEVPLLAGELPLHEIEKLSEVGAGGHVAQPHDVHSHAAC